MRLNLKKAVGSRKSTQALDAPSKFKNLLITNKVATQFLNSLRTSISCMSFPRPTAFSRLNFSQGGIFVAMLMVLASVLFAPALFAKEAEPMAADPELEKRVNVIASELRCLVCQNQTIADSSAGLAVDLKNQVREMVKAGQSEKEIVDYMVTRYGDFVLYRPPVKTTTYLLWAGPFLLLFIGLTVLMINLRKRSALVADDAPLSPEESTRLQALLDNEKLDAGKEGEESKL